MSRLATLALFALMTTAAVVAAAAAEPQHCVPADIVLWGDGRHDDTAGLNAWLRGEPAVWAASGAPVGAVIAGHTFRLSAAIYVPGGTARSLEDFRLVWPERGETVSGGAIRTGSDPAAAPAVSGIRIVGGDPGEAKPLDVPDPLPAARDGEASCATS